MVQLEVPSHSDLLLEVVLEQIVVGHDLLKPVVDGTDFLTSSLLNLVNDAIVIGLGGLLIVQLLPHGSELVTEGLDLHSLVLKVVNGL